MLTTFGHSSGVVEAYSGTGIDTPASTSSLNTRQRKPTLPSHRRGLRALSTGTFEAENTPLPFETEVESGEVPPSESRSLADSQRSTSAALRILIVEVGTIIVGGNFLPHLS